MKNTAEKIQTVADLAKALKPGVVLRVPIDLIEPDPDQPRTEFPKQPLEELAADIQRRDIEDPIQVRSDGERILIKHGERRWRAAGLAKLKDVPILLAAPDAAKAPALERLFDQALHNKHHEQLTPMDWARFLRKLVDVHGLAVKDIPDALAQRGITMSRPYVSNLMRLVELPEWAAALLNQGEINASDAKAILMAKPYAKAMKWLENKIREEMKVKPDDQRLRDALFGSYEYEDMEHVVAHAYEQTAIELSATWGDKRPLFKWETSCKSCPDRQQLNRDNFCLNATCFDAKQDKARAELKSKGKSEKTAHKENRLGKDTKPKKPAGPTSINPKKVDQAGVVNVAGLGGEKFEFLDNARFAPAVHCAGCEFNKLARQYKHEEPRPCCFNVPHYQELQRNSSREEGIAQWLDQRVLPEVLAKLTGNYDLQFQLIAWMALDAPTRTADSNRVESYLSTEQRKTRQRLNLRTPGDVFRVYQEGERALDTEAIAGAGVRALLRDRGHFYAFARYLGVQLTPAIARMDEEYLAMKRKGELLELARRSGMLADGGELAKKKLDEILAFVKTPAVIDAVGVPPDVQALYDRLDPQIEANHELDDDFGDEDEPGDDELATIEEEDTGEDTHVGPE